MKPIVHWIKTHPYCLLLSYWIFYLLYFFLLEHFAQPNYLIYSPLDDKIPFMELFIIPYVLWFPLLALSLGYFMFTSKKAFQNLCVLMFSGMSIALLIYTIFPNGLDLRVEITRTNVFADIVRALQGFDTPTNVCPSIHVSSTLAILFAVLSYQNFKHPRWIKASISLLSLLIILSTMFLKQHSILDVLAGILVTCILYPLVYHTQWRKIRFPKTIKAIIE